MNTTHPSRFLIGAIASGSGKTTLTLGLLRHLRNRGLGVQPFKCGPDYIDTQFHDMASGGESYNLDLFLSSAGHVQEVFNRYGAGADVCIAEGVMGLFDGYDRMKGSSAEIATLLKLPVVLVLNAKSMAYSAAAILYGFKNFRKDLHVAGVIFNFVGSESHYGFLKEACREVGLEPLGYLPKQASLEIPSRHLGLDTDRLVHFDTFAEEAAALVAQYIDIDRLLALTAAPAPAELPVKAGGCIGSWQIAVARDKAFTFMYHENIRQLERLGTVTYFSPLEDEKLPDADFVYLPGGYPELYTEQLSSNISMLESIRRYAAAGGKIWAECGGMMYLLQSVTGREGISYPMAGIFPYTASLERMKLTLGYRSFSYKGIEAKGHEFHYSTIDSEDAGEVVQYNAKGSPVNTRLFRYKNVLAGYTHLYWGENAKLIQELFK